MYTLSKDHHHVCAASQVRIPTTRKYTVIKQTSPTHVNLTKFQTLLFLRRFDRNGQRFRTTLPPMDLVLPNTWLCLCVIEPLLPATEIQILMGVLEVQVRDALLLSLRLMAC